MVAPTSTADICNLALDYLLQTNEEVVTNIDTPNTQTEVICQRWYDQTRREVLRKGIWNFALRRKVLTADATAPAFGFTRAFNLPVDFIRIATIENPDNTEPFPIVNYEIENNQILLNADADASLNLRYVANVEAVTSFDSLFVQALAVRLAYNIAYKFTSSNTNVQRLDGVFREALAGARAVDGIERPPRRIERSNALTRRRLLGSNQRSGITFE